MNLPARLRRRSQRDADAVRREFWARVAARNGSIPPRVPVEDRDHGMPWVVALVVVAIGAGLVYIGWSLAVGLVLAGATWSVR